MATGVLLVFEGGQQQMHYSFTSGLANDVGVAPELRIKLTGYSSERVHRCYSQKAAMAKLPSLDRKGHLAEAARRNHFSGRLP